MQNKLFLKAADICELLEVKQTSAYEIIGNLNKELEEQGYLTLRGKVPTKYFVKRFYGVEFNAFLETVSDKPETRMAFLLLYWTGMRIGELLALTYNDINLEEKTISINKSYQRLKGKDMITQPKTPKSIRVITMPDFLTEEFREYCSHLYGIMKKERLFRFTKSHMEHCMATGIARSGVKRIRLHDLRHSHASMLVDMGVIPLEIAERLGHEKVETTLNTYSHLYPSTQSKLRCLGYMGQFSDSWYSYQFRYCSVNNSGLI